jgi:hypothetical protein
MTTNRTNSLFIASGRPTQGDKRNLFVKTIDQIIEDGFIQISIQQIGKIWTNQNFKDSQGNLKKFNIEIKGYGCTGKYYDSSFSAKDLLTYVAQFIKFPKVAESHIQTLRLNSMEICECDRCNGQGFIKAFDYYCDGICFKCYGSKYVPTKKTLIV